MEKKRRTSPPKESCVKATDFQQLWRLESDTQKCGLHSKTFSLRSKYGKGWLKIFEFEGMYFRIFEAAFKKSVTITGEIKHEFAELAYLLAGQQLIFLQNTQRNYTFESQQGYLLYSKGLQGQVKYLNSKTYREIRVRLNNKFIQKHQLNDDHILEKKYAVDHFLNHSALLLNSQQHSIVTTLFKDNRSGLLKRLFLESKVLELFGLHLETSAIPPKPLFSGDQTLAKLYQAQQIITNNLHIQYAITDLARQIGLNDFVLKKEFKQVFGQTIFEFSNEARMKKAEDLLLHSELPIYEISEMVGYKNATHFSAAFKKHLNITPKKFRMQR